MELPPTQVQNWLRMGQPRWSMALLVHGAVTAARAALGLQIRWEASDVKSEGRTRAQLPASLYKLETSPL